MLARPAFEVSVCMLGSSVNSGFAVELHDV